MAKFGAALENRKIGYVCDSNSNGYNRKVEGRLKEGRRKVEGKVEGGNKM